MKTSFPLLILIFSLSFTSLLASGGEGPVKKGDLFSQDEVSAAYDALSELDELEKTAISEGLNLQEMENTHPELLDGLNITSESSLANQMGDDDPAGIPAFWWGFCLGIAGILIVYLLTEDQADSKDQLRKALKGFLYAIGISVILYLLYIVLVVVLFGIQ